VSTSGGERSRGKKAAKESTTMEAARRMIASKRRLKENGNQIFSLGDP